MPGERREALVALLRHLPSLASTLEMYTTKRAKLAKVKTSGTMMKLEDETQDLKNSLKKRAQDLVDLRDSGALGQSKAHDMILEVSEALAAQADDLPANVIKSFRGDVDAHVKRVRNALKQRLVFVFSKTSVVVGSRRRRRQSSSSSVVVVVVVSRRRRRCQSSSVAVSLVVSRRQSSSSKKAVGAETGRCHGLGKVQAVADATAQGRAAARFRLFRDSAARQENATRARPWGPRPRVDGGDGPTASRRPRYRRAEATGATGQTERRLAPLRLCPIQQRPR